MSNEQSALREGPSALEPLVSLVRDSLGQMTPEQCLRGEAFVAANFPRRQRQRPAWLIPASAFAVGSLAAVLLWNQYQSATPALLSYVVENGSLAEDHALPAQGKRPRIVRFSDGTEVRVEDGSRANVRYVTEHGAALAMSRGSLHADVVHSSNSAWQFDAGPFVVHVTGTAFGLAWDPDQDRFDLRLEHGSVTVTSPVANDPIPLRAGQWLTIRMRSNEVFIRDLAGHAPLEPSVEAPLPAAPEPEATVLPPARAESRGAVKPSANAGLTWAQDLASGRAEQVVEDALRRGLDNCLSTVGSGDLAALADAARYSRRDEIARKALLAQRRRFPGSHVAVDAGLFLGRLAEAEHDDRQALSWINTYLAEAPSGRYAADALGRKMALLRRTGGTAAARAIAEEYLGKYPSGTYASAARAILKSP